MPRKAPEPSKTAKAPNQAVPVEALTNAQLLEDLAWCCNELAWRLQNYEQAAEEASQEAIDEGLLLCVKADRIMSSAGLFIRQMRLEKLATRSVGPPGEES